MVLKSNDPAQFDLFYFFQILKVYNPKYKFKCKRYYMSWFFIILIVIIIGILLWVAGIYNRLVQLQNQVKNNWSQIDVQLQRRYDLIPNLIEAVKGYMQHERETLEMVVEARNKAQQARNEIAASGGPTESSLKELATAEMALRGATTQIFALAENYPQLRASENMQQLQEELSSTENKVAFSRQAYNDSVMTYNTVQQQFPTLYFAKAFGHHPVDLFQTESEEIRKAPRVSF